MNWACGEKRKNQWWHLRWHKWWMMQIKSHCCWPLLKKNLHTKNSPTMLITPCQWRRQNQICLFYLLFLLCKSQMGKFCMCFFFYFHSLLCLCVCVCWKALDWNFLEQWANVRLAVSLSLHFRRFRHIFDGDENYRLFLHVNVTAKIGIGNQDNFLNRFKHDNQCQFELLVLVFFLWFSLNNGDVCNAKPQTIWPIV